MARAFVLATDVEQYCRVQCYVEARMLHLVTLKARPDDLRFSPRQSEMRGPRTCSPTKQRASTSMGLILRPA